MVILYPNRGWGRAVSRPSIAGGTIAQVGADWRQVRDLSLQGHLGVGSAGRGPSDYEFQGFAAGVAFSDDSASFYGVEQEGDYGIFKATIAGIANPAIKGFTVNNGIYNNPRALAQRGGVLFTSSSIGANIVYAMDAVTMNALPTWGGAASLFGYRSHAAETDGVWGFAGGDTLDSTGNASLVTLLCYNIANSATAFSWQHPSHQSGGIYKLSLDTANRRMAIGDNNNHVYLLDYSPLYNATPSAPVLINTGTTLDGAGYYAVLRPGGGRMYVFNPTAYLIDTWDITTVTAPVKIAGGSYTGGWAAYNTSGYATMDYDPIHHFLYLSWPRTTNLINGGMEVLSVNTSTDALTQHTTFAPFTMGATVYPPDYTVLSPDMTKYGMGTGGGGHPGGCQIWDVTAIATGGAPTILSIIPCNAETRTCQMNPDDTIPYVYVGARYSLCVHNADDTLRNVDAPGWITGNYMIPYGKGAGVENGVFWMPGNGFEDVVVKCLGGAFSVLWDQGSIPHMFVAYDGTYAYVLEKSTVDYLSPRIWVYPINADYTFGAALDAFTFTLNYTAQLGGGYLLPSVAPFGHPGAILWAAIDGIGVVKMDMNSSTPTGGSAKMSIITEDAINYPIGTPSVNTAAGGSSGNANVYFKFTAYYYDPFNALVGFSSPSNVVQCLGGSNAFVVTLAGGVPATATGMQIGGEYSFDNFATSDFGPSPVPETGGLVPASTATVTITSDRTAWSGGEPTQAIPFQNAGGCYGIVEYAAGNRVYVAQGDQGIRVYNRATGARTSQLLGYTADPTNGIASSHIAFTTMGPNGATLVSTNYTFKGSGNGIRFYDLTTNVDNPTFRHVATGGAGFTVSVTPTTIWLNALVGPLGFRYQ
jgi:hypothetical protein